MGDYSLVDFFQIKQIISYYNLPEPVCHTPTIEGISNSNYKVNLLGGEKVLLKISNDKTLEQLNNEQDILATLHKYGFKYSLRPYRSLKGRLIYEHKGLYGVIFPFIEGLPPIIDDKSIKQIGHALGELHALEIHKEDLETLRPHNLVGHGGVSIREYCEQDSAPQDFKLGFLKNFPHRLEDIPYDVFPCGIIHGDLYFDNSLFHAGKLVSLIDFEQSGRGRFILDLGIALSGSCLNEQKTDLDANLMREFLKGYQMKRKLLAIEKEYLRMAIAVGFYSIALWRIKRFYEGDLDQRKRFNYRELMERCERYHKNFSENHPLFTEL